MLSPVLAIEGDETKLRDGQQGFCTAACARVNLYRSSDRARSDKRECRLGLQISSSTGANKQPLAGYVACGSRNDVMFK
jgi:hypothetical protein